ncbi:hypothetical protein GIW56_09425 [Pseudomonas gessardii]|uniref:DUF2799 domain-containing protein n=1 Tax=Pseudomonas gessardii TaxID=78544 RepID=A0ABS9F697_9PSED|nr:hypothetical protein [Pseudomonas gessardii]MCF4977734.1 hypothetical protein [Pseudomonas gessardii]MCF4993844.1 hypothetical protein [Pseudomonas gessardii]MCF5088125.1 hypothetical protein [Pseudomonas gessardii]MCF5097599.1 hypothetical protein [Pseudomonas gessardii]MCF5107058.1 hypothetical protein [Pseudomonas gessardii]
MKIIFAVATFAILTGCASSGTINTLSEKHYECNASGSFSDFSADNAIETCRKKIDQFCQTNGALPVIGKITSEPSGYARYATADLNFQCISAKDAALQQQQMAEIKNQQMKATIQSAKATCQQDFGFTPNTPEFGNCLLQLQQQSAQDKREEASNAASAERAEVALAQQRREASDKNAMEALQMINSNNNKTLDRMNNTTGKKISCTSSSYGSTLQTDCN